jgi:hypothetical protein
MNTYASFGTILRNSIIAIRKGDHLAGGGITGIQRLVKSSQ